MITDGKFHERKRWKMNKFRLGTISIIVMVVASACSQSPNVSSQDQTPNEDQQPPPPLVAPIVDCANTGAGSFVTCRIGRANCSYRQDINGDPTFCNDAPFPSHSFTLLVWGQNWSDYDGRCLLVTGQVTRFEGKLQIVATSRSQIESC